MSELTPAQAFVDSPQLEVLRSHIRNVHQTNFADVAALEAFIGVYDDFSAAVSTEEHLAFLEKLDLPDIGVVFNEEVLDQAVAAHEMLSGDPYAVIYADTGRVPSDDWQQELQTLQHIFDPAYREQVGAFHADVLHDSSHAKYVQEHYEELKRADPARYHNLLAEPAFLQAITRVFNHENSAPDALIDGNITSFEPTFISDVLRASGYAFADTYDDDWTYTEEGEKRTTLNANLKAIARLEKQQAGAVKLLSEHYGIRHFARYPLELLQAQFSAHEELARPYGVVISAVPDHNGAYTQSALLQHHSIQMERLYEDTKNSYDLKVCEAKSPSEFTQRLKAFDDRYGAAHKISFAVIEAHGTEEVISFGAQGAIGSTALQRGFEHHTDIFTPGALLIVNACSTGKEGGIAQRASSIFSVYAIAPVADCNLKSIGFFNDGSARLTPHFEDSNGRHVPAMIYKNGELLGTI